MAFVISSDFFKIYLNLRILDTRQEEAVAIWGNIIVFFVNLPYQTKTFKLTYYMLVKMLRRLILFSKVRAIHVLWLFLFPVMSSIPLGVSLEIKSGL